MKSNSQKGVALVITLIFLSVITFMAVTFLVVSRRGSEQVTTLTQQATAKNAADAALQQAAAQIISLAFAQTNGFNFGLVVSTNYGSAAYDGGGVRNAITNVSYVEINGAPLSQKDLPVMLNNLLILPRPPVFISTNKTLNASSEFRFYLDLNRNGVFDTNGVVPVVVDNSGKTNGLTTSVVGDPEWIGILDHPEQRHSASNQFIARYAFIALPIGNSLDINYIHNQAKEIATNSDGFLRDQGVGSWEINLAGFLNALNPGFWNYNFYDTNTTTFFSSQGLAFDDAAAILEYRYAGNYNNTLSSFNNLYGAVAANIFDNDFIDGYSRGPLMTNLSPLTFDSDNVNLPWSGADSTNHFFTTQDLFTSVPAPAVGASFSNRLHSAGTNLDTFDRYTFYRMLSQMSFGSAPDPTNKLDLNYKNIQGFASTNFVRWAPLEFFTNAADRLLKSHPNFIITNVVGVTTNTTNLSTSYIPIYPTNYYTPAVHRMLQLAANIYDASTNKTTNAPNDFDYPSVFRPIFNKTIINGVTNVFITGYTSVGTNADYNAVPLSLPEDLALVTANTTNIYGIPWVIGAKRGFPNFNEFAMQSTIQLQRKLEIDKKFKGNNRANWATNTQYIIAISNAVGVEAWNSYSSNYTRQIDIIGADTLTMVLTNELGIISNGPPVTYPLLMPVNNWPRFPNSQSPPASLIAASFQIPLYTNTNFVPDSVYHINGTLTRVINSATTPFDVTAPRYPQPGFGLNITNRLRFIMVDHASGRVIDYATFNGMDLQRNLLQELKADDNFGPGGVWDTNRWGGSLSDQVPIRGVINQVQISLGLTNIPGGNPPYNPVTDSDWTDAQAVTGGFHSKQDAITNFQSFYNDTTGAIYPGLTNQVPFAATRIISVYQTWQANDPLVHYTLSDLTGLGDLTTLPQTNYPKPGTATNLVLKNIGRVNDRYMPWSLGNTKVVDPKYGINLALKDPLVKRSDDWQFPTNRYPNIGWLGRVHRGTPWQTVYMKSAPVDATNWQNWSGNANLIDAGTMQPTNDWAIFDLFTTAPNDNASRGQLSINQTNFAAWAAILDGVIVITNDATNGFKPLVIDPNTNSFALQQIVNGINAQRAATVTINNLVQPLYPGQVFTRLGDVLSTPQLTVASPFLNTNASVIGPNAPNDAAYERIPQQIMSLLRVGTPRYVIFAYGQSLKPADHSILTSGGPGILGMCTNYQITGEVATRTVVRFEPSGPLSPTNHYTPLNPTQNPVMPFRKSVDPAPAPVPPPRAVIESFTVLPPE
jgi:hypothetical protein